MVLASCRCLGRQHQLRSEQLSSVGMTVFLAVASSRDREETVSVLAIHEQSR
jgi:hypothetical protein